MEKTTLQGYGIVTDQLSCDLGGFKEVISPEALKGIIERSDVMFLLNHCDNRGLLARSTNGRGSLKLSVDNKGLRFEFEVPNYSLGHELAENVRRGDVRGCSFGFHLSADGSDERWEKGSNGMLYRTVIRFSVLGEISACYNPAYRQTSIEVKASSRSELHRQHNLLKATI